MPADHGAKQTLMGQVVQPAFLSITLTCCKYQRQVVRMPGLQETLFDRDQQLIGNANPDKARRRHGVAVMDQGCSVCGGDDLSLHSLSLERPSETVDGLEPRFDGIEA